MSKNNPDKDTEKKDTAENNPKDVPEDISKDIPKDTPEESPKDSSEKNDADTPEDISEEVTDHSHEEDNEEDIESTNEGVQESNDEYPTTGDEDSGMMNNIGNRIGWGYIALIVVIVVVLLFGFKDRILQYFSGEQKAKVPKVVNSKLPNTNPIIPSAAQMPDSKQKIKSSQADKQMQVSVNDSAMQSSQGQQKMMTENDVKMVVKDFILNNPEVIMQSVAKLEKKAAEKKAKESKQYLNESSTTIAEAKPFIGNKNGTIHMIEFFDYRCIHCHKVYPQLIKLISTYPNLKISLIPLPFMGTASTKAARFSLAVNNLYPNKFYAFHSDLIKSKTINEKVIFDLIKKYKLDKNKLVEEANSDKVDNLLKENLQIAQKSGVQGVPSFVVNGKFVPGAISYEDFKKLIDAAKSSPSQS